jgi:predicted nicotinamide N-methyase
MSAFEEVSADLTTMSLVDACSEFLMCARYGEDEDLLAMLSATYEGSSSIPINHADTPSGNTALHLACANGHTSTVQLLLAQSGVLHLTNLNGNFPLHWAATNGHAAIAQMLIDAFPDLDVLAQNSFGKSCLTEGFGANNTDLLKILLEHPSAEEDKIITGIKGMTKEEVDVPDDMKSQEPISTTHVFGLGGEGNATTLTVREQVMQNADSPFTTEDQDDTTGLAIWAASLVCARWLADIGSKTPEVFEGLNVLELGAGCGVPGLAVAAYGKPKVVDITDLNDDAIMNTKHNISLLKEEAAGVCSVYKMDWADESTWPKEKVDVLIGADLVYTPEIVPLLRSAMDGVVREGGSFYYVAPDEGRAGLKDFVDAVKETWECVQETMAPQEYVQNPLASGDDDMLILHFNELTEKKFVLYEFRKKK